MVSKHSNELGAPVHNLTPTLLREAGEVAVVYRHYTRSSGTVEYESDFSKKVPLAQNSRLVVIPLDRGRNLHHTVASLDEIHSVMSVTTLLDNDFLGHTQERAQLAQEESQKVMRMFELTHRQKPL